MITVTNFRKLRTKDYDYCFAIVRSMVNTLDGVRHLPVLSPSPCLFHKYRELAMLGQWNKKAFDTMYAPTFIREMNESAEAYAWLQRLLDGDNKGYKIALVCYCADASLCHRTLVAKMLRDIGANVVEL